MQYPDFKKHDRSSLRLYGYDYSSLGAYYLTICAFEKAHIFGRVMDGKMELNWLGEIVRDEWLKTAVLRPNIRLDECIIMPNHFHAIVWIVDRIRESGNVHVGATRASPLHNTSPLHKPKGPKPQSIGSIVGSFKSAVTNRAHAITPECGPVWQRNYHEHIIRDDGTLWAMRCYIRNNPSQWTKDEYA